MPFITRSLSSRIDIHPMQSISTLHNRATVTDFSTWESTRAKSCQVWCWQLKSFSFKSVDIHTDTQTDRHTNSDATDQSTYALATAGIWV